MPQDFVHLHVHSEFSLLDGLGRVEKLVERAQRLGQPALALTDHGTMHGVIPFFRACKGAGIRPVIGVEAYLTRHGRSMQGRDPVQDKDRHHLLLLAQNQTGYKNLLKICSDAQMSGYYYRPRIDAEYLATHSDGLICTTGCLAAEVPALLNPESSKQQPKLALERLQWYVDVFGKDRFFIEMQEHDIPALREVNKTLLDWAGRYEVGMVVTNDVHYVEPEDARYHDVLLCVQTGASIKQQDRMRMGGGSYYLKSGQEMRDTFRPLADLPASAFTNTLRIAEMCAVELEDRSFHLPEFAVPVGETYESTLRKLTEDGLRWRYGDRADDPEVQMRKEHELKIIHQMGFDVYFLIVADLCRYARSRNIWYNVRGSGAGSIVAHAVGITGIDPLSNNLIFERFLNPGRVSMPDFDLDFPDDQREEMIRYTIDTYGADHVAQIVSFGRMKARAAIRDVARAMDIPLEEVDRIAKLIPAIPGKPVTIEQCLGKDLKKPELAVPEMAEIYATQENIRELLDTASALEGVARHASTHAAAVIVTDAPLTEYLPVMRPQKAVITEAVTQFEFPICESIGLLKVDFLGLSTLSVMREAAKMIRDRHGIEYNLDNIPLDDLDSYTLLSSGEVAGVFQVEGAGLRRVLVDMKPTEFNHIVAAISLYRPGPMDFIPEYIAVMHGKKEAEYVHPSLEPILGETYGVCVSGDAIVADARTGRRYRLDEIRHGKDVVVWGVDKSHRMATGRVTHWIDSGFKPVQQLTLSNGASVKVTPDHRLLTEEGWRPLRELTVGDRIAVPELVVGADKQLQAAGFLSASLDRMGVEANATGTGASGLAETAVRASEQPPGAVVWEAIVSIEPAGLEHVYDLTVEGLHSFVANNIIVHNCVYQEQVIRLLTDIAGYTASEADNVRRGISKKSEKTLIQHREIFAKGAASTSGITHQDSDAIWDALLGFARYGFNRSHAADYAVITVQTAYLKAHYPLEYMAALLHVERDNTEKVAYYITESRRMGIEVLPPDVNASKLDFTVEQLPADAPPPAGRDSRIGYGFPVPPGAAIRYGLVAVKNVGEGPVEAIAAARAQGDAFRTLDDLCERVDLRKVGKKALECLIKVGALDAFGERAQLLEAMDQMIGASKSRHEAEEVGQLSMFDLLGGADLGGAQAGFASSLKLPTVDPLTPKQRLEMEKELLGVYVSSHPLQQMVVDLTGVITCTCGELDDTYAGKGVVLAGNVVRVNQITTKKGDRMAFVTLEDLQGQCDVTVFPRTWEETKDFWQQDKIVVVRGKAEKRGEKISVLCESVQDYVERAIAAGEGDRSTPLRTQPVFANGNAARQPVASFKAGRSYDEDNGSGEDNPFGPEDQESPFVLEEPEWLSEAPVAPHSPLPAPRPSVELRVTIQRTTDAEKDKKLLSWVYDLLRGRPGTDRFCIIVRKNGSAMQLDFPNDTTEFTPALEQQLTRRLGAGSVEVRENLP